MLILVNMLNFHPSSLLFFLFHFCRYGYKDVRKEDHRAFEQLLIESLEKFLRLEAQEAALESNTEYRDSISVISKDSDLPDCNGAEELRIPLMQAQNYEESGASTSQETAALPS